ncbi:MAG: hypothetical protein ACOYW3_01595 [Bacteroidota bacterium]
MEANSTLFLNWDGYMVMGGSAFVILGILILLYHEFRILMIKDYKEKFDYVNLHEVRYFWYAVIAFILAAFLFANTVLTHRIEQHGMLWFWVRVFITVCMAIILYFVLDSSVRIYYPRQLEKRLRKIRNKPRVSPAGNLMRKLSESEEDHHLEADQIAQQGSEVHSVDYDVWIDDKTGYKKVEKYMAYEHAEECSECGYFTMKIQSEEIEKKPTQDETGLLLKHFKCSYCNHREQREIVLAKLSENA